MLKLYQSLAK